MAANTVASGLLGKDHLREGRKTVHRAEILAHRDSAIFQSDPTPLRGNLDACASPDDLRRICPSLAVNLSALRSLRWSQNLRPKDLLLLWIHVACASAKRPVPPTRVLKQGFGISRPHDAYKRIEASTFGVEDDPALPVGRWTKNAAVIEGGQISNQLIDHIKPKAAGQNYAYLELVTLSKLSATWQEAALRGLMAASVRAKVYWSKGGELEWELSLQQAMELFSLAGCEDINRLRKERALPLAKILDDIRKDAWQYVRRNLSTALSTGASSGTRFGYRYSTKLLIAAEK